MPVIVQFERHEDHVRAVGILSEAEETYHGVDKGTILISRTALRILQTEGLRLRIIGGETREEEPQ